MTQSTLSIPNETFPLTRADINTALQANGSLQSGASAPGTTYAYQYWADTTNGVLKQRDSSNASWQIRGSLSVAMTPTKSASFSTTLGDMGKTFLISAASGAVTASLLAAATCGAGFWMTFKRTDSTPANAITLDGNASETIDGALTAALTNQYDTITIETDGANWFIIGQSEAIASVNGGPVAGFRNRIINGAMLIDQRNESAAQTFTAAAAIAYCVDRFYASCTGANVTGQRVGGTGADQFVYQFTGAASVTGILFGQRIALANIYELNSSTVTLSVELANSLLTTVTWTAYYANTSDTFSAKTQIATGTFTVNSTMTRYNAQIALPVNATSGVAIELSVGAQTSGTWKIGQVQLEPGSVATPFERRMFAIEETLCETYYEKSFPRGTAPAQNSGSAGLAYGNTVGGAVAAYAASSVAYKTRKRTTTPNITFYNTSAANAFARNNTKSTDATATSAGAVTDAGFTPIVTGLAAWAAGDGIFLNWVSENEL